MSGASHAPKSDEKGSSLLSTDAVRPAKRSMSALQLGLLLFFLTAGGPFGIEPAVQAGGALVVILGSLGIAFLWAFPQAILATELGLMMESNGGGFLWVHRAWGPFIGWLNGWNALASSFINLGLLVLLFPGYLSVATNPWVPNAYESFGIAAGFVVVTILINIVGFRWVSRISGVILVYVFLPFVLLVIWGLATGALYHADWTALATVPDWDTHFRFGMSTFVGTLVWAFGGFDSLGSIAGEIAGGKRTFFLGLACSMPLMLLNYSFPLCVAFPFSPDLGTYNRTDGSDPKWQSGYLAMALFQATPWLGYVAVSAAIAATFAQLSSSIMSVSRVIWAASKSTGKYKLFPSFVALSWQRHTGTVRPIFAIVFAGTLAVLLTLMDFGTVVQMYLVSRFLNLLFLYSALIRLRYTEPDAPRPFKAPGILPYILGIPTVLIGCVAFYFSDWIVYASAAVFEAAVVGGYFIRWLWLRRFPEENVLFGEPPRKGEQQETTLDIQEQNVQV